jgi:hypothetical protein
MRAFSSGLLGPANRTMSHPVPVFRYHWHHRKTRSDTITVFVSGVFLFLHTRFPSFVYHQGQTILVPCCNFLATPLVYMLYAMDDIIYNNAFGKFKTTMTAWGFIERSESRLHTQLKRLEASVRCAMPRDHCTTCGVIIYQTSIPGYGYVR